MASTWRPTAIRSSESVDNVEIQFIPVNKKYLQIDVNHHGCGSLLPCLQEGVTIFGA